MNRCLCGLAVALIVHPANAEIELRTEGFFEVLSIQHAEMDGAIAEIMTTEAFATERENVRSAFAAKCDLEFDVHISKYVTTMEEAMSDAPYQGMHWVITHPIPEDYLPDRTSDYAFEIMDTHPECGENIYPRKVWFWKEVELAPICPARELPRLDDFRNYCHDMEAQMNYQCGLPRPHPNDACFSDMLSIMGDLEYLERLLDPRYR